MTLNSLFWPIAIVSILTLTHAARKCYIVGAATFHFIISKDRSFRPPNYDPGEIDESKAVRKTTKTLILLRHGESTWNEVVNRGLNITLPLRLISALAREIVLFITNDSCLFDAPLSFIGVTQTKHLNAFLIKGWNSIQTKKIQHKQEQSSLSLTSSLSSASQLIDKNDSSKSMLLTSQLQSPEQKLQGEIQPQPDSSINPDLYLHHPETAAELNKEEVGSLLYQVPKDIIPDEKDDELLLENKEVLKYITILMNPKNNKDNKNNNNDNNSDNDFSSVIVTSPLRRCVETVSLSLFHRLHQSKEKIYIVSTLQEMTRNIDGVSLAKKKNNPPISWTLRTLENEYQIDWNTWLNDRLDPSEHYGLKPKESRGDDRINKFVNWLYNKFPKQNTIIVSGHSLWFKCFFNAYLPKTSTYEGKTYKIINGGVIACKMTQYEFQDGSIKYKIHQDSLFTIHGGFDIGKKNW